MNADDNAARLRDAPEEGLPDDVLQALVLDLDAPPADAALVARVGARVAARTAPPASQFVNIASRDGWQPLAAGVDHKVLFDDGSSVSFLIRLAARVALPSHEHIDGAEECLVLEGDLWLDDEHLAAGDYQLAPEGTTHRTIRSDRGCLLFARGPSSFVHGAMAALGADR
jgi:anti-sigma factor ChrR (cupin superfamily)